MQFIYQASENGHIEIIKYLHSIGAKINDETYNKWTPLMIGILHHNIAFMNELILILLIFLAKWNGHYRVEYYLKENKERISLFSLFYVFLFIKYLLQKFCSK